MLLWKYVAFVITIASSHKKMEDDANETEFSRKYVFHSFSLNVKKGQGEGGRKISCV